jgi:hypothetical protein
MTPEGDQMTPKGDQMTPEGDRCGMISRHRLMPLLSHQLGIQNTMCT